MWQPGDAIKRSGIPGVVTQVRTSFSAYYHLDNGSCGECLNELLEKDTAYMARPRKSEVEKKAAAAAKVTDSLLDAAKFCAPGYKEGGESYSTTAMIYGKYLTTFSGVVMYGHPINLDFAALPDFRAFYAALKASDGKDTQITQLDPGRLSIKSKGFRTVVPCLTDAAQVSRPATDAPVAMLDSRMREAFEVVKQFVSKTGENILDSAALMDNGRITATDRKLIVCYNHGIPFPRMTVPADFIEAVLKSTKPLVSFGFSAGSVTFYYDDGAFIRSNLYAEDYPDVESVWPSDWNGMQQLPDTFFDSLDKISPFVTERGNGSFAVMKENRFQTHPEDDIGTQVDCPGVLAANVGIDVDRFRKLRGKITHVDFVSDKNKAKFFGENIFGLCVQAVFYEAEDPAPHGYTEQNGAPPIETEHVETGPATVYAGGTPQFAPPQPVQYEDDGEPEDDSFVIEGPDEQAPEAPAQGGWTLPKA